MAPRSARADSFPKERSAPHSCTRVGVSIPGAVQSRGDVALRDMGRCEIVVLGRDTEQLW